jgi:hypothetical protein
MALRMQYDGASLAHCGFVGVEVSSERWSDRRYQAFRRSVRSLSAPAWAAWLPPRPRTPTATSASRCHCCGRSSTVFLLAIAFRLKLLCLMRCNVLWILRAVMRALLSQMRKSS